VSKRRLENIPYSSNSKSALDQGLDPAAMVLVLIATLKLFAKLPFFKSAFVSTTSSDTEHLLFVFSYLPCFEDCPMLVFHAP